MKQQVKEAIISRFAITQKQADTIVAEFAPGMFVSAEVVNRDLVDNFDVWLIDIKSELCRLAAKGDELACLALQAIEVAYG